MTDGECLIDNMPNVRDTNVLLDVYKRQFIKKLATSKTKLLLKQES